MYPREKRFLPPSRRGHVIFLFCLAVLCAPGCKPGVGSSCDKGEARCQDHHTQLACQAGHYIATPCRGPKGCALTDAGISCDISKNKPGDPCSTDDEGAALCLGKKKMVVCRGGKYRLAPCRGPEGCQKEDDRAKCDTSISVPGDECHEPGSKACSTDGKQLLSCQGGKMALVNYCRGADGCTAAPGGKLGCDMSVAKEGDPCGKTMDGRIACSADMKGTVKCDHGKFVGDEKCKAGKTCATADGNIACEKKKKDG